MTYLDQLEVQIELAFLHFMEFGINDERTQRLVLGIFELWKDHTPEWIESYDKFRSKVGVDVRP